MVVAERKISAPQLSRQHSGPKSAEISPASQLAQLEIEQKLRQGEQDTLRRASRESGVKPPEEENEKHDFKEMHIDYRVSTFII